MACNFPASKEGVFCKINHACKKHFFLVIQSNANVTHRTLQKIIDLSFQTLYTRITPMGSSRPAFGMDSRQSGKKFPGCLTENARPSLSISVGLFILNGRFMRTWAMFFLLDILLITAYLLLLMRQKIREMIGYTSRSATT